MTSTVENADVEQREDISVKPGAELTWSNQERRPSQHLYSRNKCCSDLGLVWTRKETN